MAEARGRRVVAARTIAAVLAASALAMAVLVGLRMSRPDPAALIRRAEHAASEKRWPEAASFWAEVNRTSSATGSTHWAEAQARLKLERAREAEASIERATIIEPTLAEPWRLWLELLRLEDRPAEALRVGREAIRAVQPIDRRDVLKALTLALFADPPDDVALPTLRAWAQADPDDLNARLAVLARQVLAGPRQSGPIAARAARAATLEAMFERSPEHPGVRAATVAALAESGDVERGRALLESWPEAARDLGYQRLRGRWALDYDDRPVEAEAAYRSVLDVLPFDWKTRTRLARALHAQGRSDEANREAETVARHREALDPSHLGPRLTRDLERLDEAPALADLAALCESVGLPDVAVAWRAEARAARELAGRTGDPSKSRSTRKEGSGVAL